MQVIFDDRGFVLSFAFIGDLVGGTELPDPEDFDLFMHKFYAFQLVDGKLVYNETEYETHLTEELKAENQLTWVTMMNNLRSAAEEVVLKELIYS